MTTPTLKGGMTASRIWRRIHDITWVSAGSEVKLTSQFSPLQPKPQPLKQSSSSQNTGAIPDLRVRNFPAHDHRDGEGVEDNLKSLEVQRSLKSPHENGF